MLDKKNRLSKDEILETIKKGALHKGDAIDVRVFKTEDKKDPRFAFVVLKKATNSAVKRNLLKRRSRSIVRKHNSNLNKGYWFVFLFKKGIAEKTFVEIEKELISILKNEDYYN